MGDIVLKFLRKFCQFNIRY